MLAVHTSKSSILHFPCTESREKSMYIIELLSFQQKQLSLNYISPRSLKVKTAAAVELDTSTAALWQGSVFHQRPSMDLFTSPSPTRLQQVCMCRPGSPRPRRARTEHTPGFIYISGFHVAHSSEPGTRQESKSKVLGTPWHRQHSWPCFRFAI